MIETSLMVYDYPTPDEYDDECEKEYPFDIIDYYYDESKDMQFDNEKLSEVRYNEHD